MAHKGNPYQSVQEELIGEPVNGVCTWRAMPQGKSHACTEKNCPGTQWDQSRPQVARDQIFGPRSSLPFCFDELYGENQFASWVSRDVLKLLRVAPTNPEVWNGKASVFNFILAGWCQDILLWEGDFLSGHTLVACNWVINRLIEQAVSK